MPDTPVPQTKVNLAQVARALGVRAQTASYYVHRCGCPFLRRSTGRGYPWVLDLDAVVQWRRRYLAERNGGAVAKSEFDPEQQARLRTIINDLEARLQSARAELAAFEAGLPDQVIDAALNGGASRVAEIAHELVQRRAELEVIRMAVRTVRMRFTSY
jgi:phage terminase Nu1 subunit (DNA packaging protein)